MEKRESNRKGKELRSMEYGEQSRAVEIYQRDGETGDCNSVNRALSVSRRQPAANGQPEPAVALAMGAPAPAWVCRRPFHLTLLTAEFRIISIRFTALPSGNRLLQRTQLHCTGPLLLLVQVLRYLPRAWGQVNKVGSLVAATRWRHRRGSGHDQGSASNTGLPVASTAWWIASTNTCGSDQ